MGSSVSRLVFIQSACDWIQVQDLQKCSPTKSACVQEGEPTASISTMFAAQYFQRYCNLHFWFVFLNYTYSLVRLENRTSVVKNMKTAVADENKKDNDRRLADQKIGSRYDSDTVN